jgi:penicillin-binding protein 1A
MSAPPNKPSSANGFVAQLRAFAVSLRDKAAAYWLANRPGKTPAYRRFFVGVVVAMVLLVLIPVGFVVYVLFEMPPLRALENPQTNLSTVVYSADGESLGAYYVGENRVNVPVTEMPKALQEALLAREDVRFYSHSGIDPVFVFTAPFRVLMGETRGGSTLTQQLARNLYNDAVGLERSVVRKVKEAVVAVYLERRFTKQEILAAYLNTVPFGGTMYGIEAAAKGYFGKRAKDLEPQEGALLVGILKGPSIYSPFKYPKRAQAERNRVLEQMEKYGFLTRAKADSLQRLPLNTRTTRGEDHNEGLAPYFREQLRGWLAEWCQRKGYDMYTSGLRVQTTLNARMQRYAEQAVDEHLSDFQKVFDKQVKGREPWIKDTSILGRAITQSPRFTMQRAAGVSRREIMRSFRQKQPMQVFKWNERRMVDTVMTPLDSLAYYARFLLPGLVCLEPGSGKVLAWVGGLDHRFFQYDHVKQGKRQVGSTFKPFVYTAAFDNGYSPCHEELNIPIEVETPQGMWSPKNSDESIGGYLTLRSALAQSKNIITARLITAIGPEVVANYAYKMGIQSKLEAVPSLALGTTDLSVLELTGAYATFVDKGRFHEPIFVSRIEDKFGNVLEEFRSNSREALSEETAYLMVDMLRAVVNEGTGGPVRWVYGVPYDVDLGGKTGTTQEHADGWFMGITPFFACGVWVGHADRAVSFPTIEYGQGGRMALPIWAKFMRKVYDDKELAVPRTFFARPPNMKVEIDCAEYRKRHPRSTDGDRQLDRPARLDFDH